MKRNARHAAKRNTWAYRALGAATAVVVTGALGAGCLTRPVQRAAPLTKLNFTAAVKASVIDKVDLLFMIDNSSSMGDKQTLLVDVVPDLLGRLVAPKCVDNVTLAPSGKNVETDGSCADTNTKPEFPAVHNMHVGIVSSSIGDQGASSDKSPQTCPATSNPRQNDHAYLLQGINNSQVSDNNGFIGWFPAVKANQDVTGPARPTTDTGATTDKTGPGLFGAFAELISSVGETGCGYEAQLESWYRFLIQPDPYKTIDTSATTRALVGFDKTILQQRHDFLRPDSLVAVIALTDENDSTVDPMALSGTSWVFEAQGGAPRATSQCATNPNDPKCQNCLLAKITSGDPACAKGSTYATGDPADGTNIRFYHMKQRFGVDPQFPIQRYIDGLSSTVVPNRDGEHPPLKGGSGVSSSYVGNKNCTNPLFASDLPTGDAGDDPKAGDVDGPLCALSVSGRDTKQVFFATIGGIPWQLLTSDPSDPNAPFKTDLSDDDWTHIIGKDPLNYDFTSADVHMLESATARPGVGNPDAYNTRDWDTTPGTASNAPNDLEYACTFDLKALGLQRDCAKSTAAGASCDCSTGSKSPLCDKANPTTQILGKTYPTIREFSVVRGLKEQGIAASLCPRSFDDKSDYFGYRPAVAAIIGKLASALNNTCVPQKLIPDPNNNNNVPCLVLVTLYNTPGGEEQCTSDKGLSAPDPEVLAKFRQNQESIFKQQGGNGRDPADYPVCALDQIPVPTGSSCTTDSRAGWCYVENTPDQGATGPALNCGHAVLFTATGTIPGGIINLQCIEQDNLGSGGAGGSSTTTTTEAGAASTGDTE